MTSSSPSKPSALLADVLDLDQKLHIVDIGGGRFSQTEEHYKRLVMDAHARVTAFDPREDADLYDLQGSSDWTLVKAAIADGKPHTLNICAQPGMSSILEPNIDLMRAYQGFESEMKVVEQYQVETHRLDDLDAARQADLIKLDIQGAEKLALEGACNTLKTTLMVECEVNFIPQYTGQPLFGEIAAQLQSHGFAFHSFMGYGSRLAKPLAANDPTDPGSQWIWSDALFIRELSQWESLSQAQLKALCILLFDVYHVYDFALKAASWLEDDGLCLQECLRLLDMV
ncbi:MAG: FkbM family methyltransferase [Pseudomonadota bacterium]